MTDSTCDKNSFAHMLVDEIYQYEIVFFLIWNTT